MVTQQNKRSLKPRYVAALVLAAIVVFVLFEFTGVTHFFRKKAINGNPAVTGGHSIVTAPPKNPHTVNSAPNEGVATDKNGQVPSSGVSTDPKQWTVSTSGLTTLKSPTKNATFKSGDYITGTASGSTIQYRLIDDQTGVISQGSISVVNDNFSASLNFKNSAATGRLDVFNIDSNGKEVNEVQVPVNF